MKDKAPELGHSYKMAKNGHMFPPATQSSAPVACELPTFLGSALALSTAALHTTCTFLTFQALPLQKNLDRWKGKLLLDVT